MLLIAGQRIRVKYDSPTEQSFRSRKTQKRSFTVHRNIFDPRYIDLYVDDIGPIADFVANYVKVANVRKDIDAPQANPIDSRRTKLLAKKVKTTGNLNEIESELEAYQKLTADDKIEPFEFWKQNEKIFKNSWECNPGGE